MLRLKREQGQDRSRMRARTKCPGRRSSPEARGENGALEELRGGKSQVRPLLKATNIMPYSLDTVLRGTGAVEVLSKK